MTSNEAATAAAALAASVAPHLPSGWALRPANDSNDPPWFATIAGPEGAELHLAIGRNGKPDRLSVSVGWPAGIGADYFAPPGAERPSITCAASKSAAQIAQDIVRRLLPAYLPLYAEATERRRRSIEARDATYRMACALGDEVGDARPRRPGEWSYTIYPAGGGRVEVAGSTIRLTLEAVTVEAAIAAVRAARGGG